MRERKNEKTTGADEEGAVVLTGLAPVVGEAPLILILGSMPGAASLAAAQYYAHPANRFWPLMALLFPEETARLSSPDYEERLEGLRRSGVALWDTIGSCERAGGKPRQQHPEHDAQRRGGSSEVASDDRDGGSQRLKECGGLEAACAAGGALGTARPSRSRASLDESRERAPAAR